MGGFGVVVFGLLFFFFFVVCCFCFFFWGGGVNQERLRWEFTITKIKQKGQKDDSKQIPGSILVTRCLECRTLGMVTFRRFSHLSFVQYTNITKYEYWFLNCYASFQMEINPSLLVAELNFDNNVATCDLWYSGYNARMSNCRFESLLPDAVP